MLKILLAIIVVAVIGVLGLASSKPDTFTVTRSASIKAPPEKIFALISDFHHWNAWSPWEKRDLAMKKTLSGANSGVGAVYEWEGNSKVGAGRMEIVNATPSSHIAIKLDFLKPIEGHNVAQFTLTPQGDTTNVTWDMTGPTPFISKVMQVFISMDKMVGGDFETGLANLKALAEK
ncbi:SRPBCC family protein [Glaciimonas soli]|uniref:Polyketide cyclase n=1 Tax=Glaciimonas soli TaxID=2590999 RepID=A0A843YT24_9BURK|nr:SRPBCC family protein [Glaciimonas soli]MQR00864.1 polyketide cyclase [Glaciimonas soli]